jgi:hypothetical protein
MIRGVLLLSSFLLLAETATGEEFYYVLVFGSQQIPARAQFAHTFAVFAKATGQGPCSENYGLEAYSISWMPQTLEIRTVALLPECGQNVELHYTIRWALSTGQRISVWGPYQIDKELYDRAIEQIRLLQGGEVLYKAIDFGYRSDHVSNCIHALSTIAEGYRLHVVSASFGETAGYYVTRRFEPWIIDPCRTHDWLVPRLGLAGYPIIHRPLENPRSSVIAGQFNRLLQIGP